MRCLPPPGGRAAATLYESAARDAVRNRGPMIGRTILAFAFFTLSALCALVAMRGGDRGPVFRSMAILFGSAGAVSALAAFFVTVD